MQHPAAATADAFSPNDGPQDLPQGGERLGRYRLRREIGRGFSSVVFEAWDLQRGRTVALKVLTFLQSLSPEQRTDLSERFAREARAISALSHPNIVAIYEVGHADDGREFIAMEMLAGESLRARLGRDGALPPAEAVAVALQLADALQYAHERGIVHRDVKPDNVFVLPDGRVKLMDFGVAHVFSDGALTQTGTVVGSPAYMSPEQIGGERLDGRSDVFSLGVVLAEMVVGHKPFEAPTIPAVMHRILTRPPQMEAMASRALRRVIEKALAKNRQARFASASALADALRRQVLPELPAWEPTSTAIMPTPSPATLSRPGAAVPKAVCWGLAAGATLAAGVLALGLSHPAARLAPSPTPTAGVVRHIPAYWRRRTALPPRPSSRPRVAMKPTVVPGVARTAAPMPASVRIVEDKPFLRVTTFSALPPAPKLAPAPPRRPAALPAPTPPRLAVAPLRLSVTPHPRPLVVKVAGFRQEQTLTPLTITPPRRLPPADQDMEQIIPPPTTSEPAGDDRIPDSAPRLLRRTPTLYPRGVPDSALGGVVTLRVFLDADGDVARAVVARSSGLAELDEAAVQTVQGWQYVPAFRDGQAVPSEATARVRFPL